MIVIPLGIDSGQTQNDCAPLSDQPAPRLGSLYFLAANHFYESDYTDKWIGSSDCALRIVGSLAKEPPILRF